MPQLFVLSGPLVGRSFELHGAVVLGRSPECGVVLADRSVSREHARIEPDGAGWRIVDLGSRNGIKVRGERVELAALHDLDEIVLGELLLRFRTSAGADAAPAAPAAAPPPAVPRAPAPAPAPPRPPPAPAAPAADPVADEGGFELEEEIHFAPPPRAGPAPAPAPPPSPAMAERDRERARILAAGQRSGLFSGDLAQWPLPLRLGAYLAVLLALGGAAYGAFWLVAKMRGG
jgi:hypothetical protein